VSIAHFKSDDEELLGFAREFFDGRVETFQKDIAICRTADAGGRHAYFPALITCIAFAELLSGLYAGRLSDLKLKDLEQYAQDFMEPEYTSDHRRLELLYECLRHKVAHLAYPYAVMPHGKPRRLVTWSIHETEERPAIEMVDYSPPRLLVQTRRPWPVSYDCRIEVRVGSLAIDIVNSIYGQSGYLKHLQSDRKAREDFAKCMRNYFPRSA
jgi:hypothetical protein